MILTVFSCPLSPFSSPFPFNPIPFCFPQPLFHSTSFNPFTIPLLLPLPILSPNPFPFFPLTNFLQALSYYDCSYLFPYSAFFNPNLIVLPSKHFLNHPSSTSFPFYFLQLFSHFLHLLPSAHFPLYHLKLSYYSVFFNNPFPVYISPFISTSFRSFPILPLQPHSHSASFNHFPMLPPSTHLPVPYPNPLIPILTTFSPCCCQWYCPFPMPSCHFTVFLLFDLFMHTVIPFSQYFHVPIFLILTHGLFCCSSPHLPCFHPCSSIHLEKPRYWYTRLQLLPSHFSML